MALPSGHIIENVETTLKAAPTQAVVRIVPPEDRMISERGWKADSQSEVELILVKSERGISWK